MKINLVHLESWFRFCFEYDFDTLNKNTNLNELIIAVVVQFFITNPKKPPSSQARFTIVSKALVRVRGGQLTARKCFRNDEHSAEVQTLN